MKKCRYSPDDAGCVDLLCFEGFHYVEKLVVNVRTITKLYLDLIQVEKGILNFEFPHHDASMDPTTGSGRAGGVAMSVCKLCLCVTDCVYRMSIPEQIQRETPVQKGNAHNPKKARILRKTKTRK